MLRAVCSSEVRLEMAPSEGAWFACTTGARDPVGCVVTTGTTVADGAPVDGGGVPGWVVAVGAGARLLVGPGSGTRTSGNGTSGAFARTAAGTSERSCGARARSAVRCAAASVLSLAWSAGAASFAVQCSVRDAPGARTTW